jgi:LPXTG-motif cell wall-anchored protein
MKRFSVMQIGALIAVGACLAPPVVKADDYDKKTIVTLDQPTEAPGIVLQPGTYVIKLLNSSSNRHIAEIMNERMNHLYALSFTIAAERVGPLTDKQNKQVLTFYEGKNGQPQAMRKWFWPGDTNGQQFLYPKDQAARIAANTGEKVPEGKLPTVAESGQSLTPDNANGLTLQSREESKPASKPFTAGAAEPAASPAPSPAPNRVIAQNTPPPTSQQPAPATDNSQSNAAAASNSNSQNTTLPQTASSMPLIGLVGLISLALAMLIASVRRYRMQ